MSRPDSRFPRQNSVGRKVKGLLTTLTLSGELSKNDHMLAGTSCIPNHLVNTATVGCYKTAAIWSPTPTPWSQALF